MTLHSCSSYESSSFSGFSSLFRSENVIKVEWFLAPACWRWLGANHLALSEGVVKKKKTIVTQCSVHPQIESVCSEKKKIEKKIPCYPLQGWFWLIWASIRALKVEIKADRLTLCPRSWKGWLVLGPARYCRRESFYCSPQQTVERKQGSNVVKKNKKKTNKNGNDSKWCYLFVPAEALCVLGRDWKPALESGI